MLEPYNDNELKKLIGNNKGATKYNIIKNYIIKTLGTSVVLKDGTNVIIDKRDANHIAHKAGNKKISQISIINTVVEEAELYAFEEEKEQNKKFTMYLYYLATAKLYDEVFPIVLNIGKSRTNATYHLYDITNKIRTSAHRINDVGRFADTSENDALEAEVLNQNISQVPIKINNNKKK